MIMHGTWYKGPQLAHTHSTGAPSTTEYHQFRSYPSFVVTPYHENPSSYEKTFPTAASTPLLVDSVFNGAGGGNGGNSGHLTVLSPTIKIEQNYNEPLSGAVEDYALNLVDCSVGENGHFKKPSNYIWSAVNADSEANNNTIPGDTTTTQIPITNTTAPIAPGTPPTPPPDSQLSVEQALKSTYNNSLKQLEDTQLIQLPQLPQEDEDEEEHQQQQQQQQHQHQQHQHQSITKGPGLRTGVVSSTSHTNKANKSKTLLTENHNSHLNSHHPHHPHHPHPHPHSHHSTTSTPSSSTMPIGGVQGQNPTQGLVHWMSAVMAEHMTGQTHHDPTAVGMHYMWNGNVDHYGQHNKEIGDHNFWPPTPPTTASAALKTKMNDHHNNLQKGHFIDDNRLDHHAVTPQGGGVLGPTGAGHHGNHVGHHSSSAASALLVVPQPINATKIGTSLGGGGGGGGGGAGTGRKYQCKMCPQVSQ